MGRVLASSFKRPLTLRSRTGDRASAVVLASLTVANATFIVLILITPRHVCQPASAATPPVTSAMTFTNSSAT
jgi:hypothetical protein